MKVYAADIDATNAYIADLEAKAESAINISKQIEGFISDSRAKLVGDVYDSFRANLEVYQYAYNKLGELCLILSNNIAAANNAYYTYVTGSPDDPACVDYKRIEYWENLLKEKKARLAYLESVPEYRGNGIINEFGVEGTEPNEPQYSEAQREIPIVKAEIERIEFVILPYLRRLPSENSNAVETVSSIKEEIQQFVNNVNSLNVSNVNL